MKVSRIRKAVALVVAASSLVLGCELIVDFDRTKIPVEGSDGAAVVTDASVDAVFDTSVPDSAAAAVPDAADAAVFDAGDAADAAD